MQEKKILIIEDNPKHIQDAREFFAKKSGIDIIIARNSSEAGETLCKYERVEGEFPKRVKPEIDGVISDIYFPLCDSSQWDQPEPIGIKIAIECSKVKLPFVLNTAGFHHGRKYEWIYHLAQSEDWTIIDSGNDYEQDADSKDWKRAFEALERNISRQYQ